MKLSTLFSSNQMSTETISQVAEKIGDLSVSIAGVAGNVEDAGTNLRQQSEVLNSVASYATQISSESQSVTQTTISTQEITISAESVAADTTEQLKQTLTYASQLAEGVKSVGDRLEAVQNTLDRIRILSDEIDSISQRTSLLSLNAAVEAARAGESGQGFRVVAAEFKSLSEYTAKSTVEISNTLETLTSEIQSMLKQSTASIKIASILEDNTQGIGEKISEVPRVLHDVVDAQKSIVSANQTISQAVSQIETDIQALSHGVSESASSVSEASNELDTLRALSENIIGATARLGTKTTDTPFIQKAKETAAAISKRLEAALAKGEISEMALFDTHYEAIPQTDPVQYTTAAIGLLDRVLPDLQEPVLTLSDRVVFCTAVDSNGYLPVHNKKFSQPQRLGDPEWNQGNSRNRRIFADRVGLAAGRNTSEFLLQAYRRDMGNGQFTLMKDLSVPITVNGKHWGGLRLAYHV